MRKGGNRSENAKNGVYDARKPAAGENFWGYMKILLKNAPLKCPRFFLRGGGAFLTGIALISLLYGAAFWPAAGGKFWHFLELVTLGNSDF